MNFWRFDSHSFVCDDVLHERHASRNLVPVSHLQSFDSLPAIYFCHPQNMLKVESFLTCTTHFSCTWMRRPLETRDHNAILPLSMAEMTKHKPNISKPRHLGHSSPQNTFTRIRNKHEIHGLSYLQRNRQKRDDERWQTRSDQVLVIAVLVTW